MLLPGATVGIDIGSRSVKVALLRERRHLVRAVRFAEEQLPQGYRWEVGGERGPLVATIRGALAKAGIRARAAVIAMPRRQVTARISALPPADRAGLRRVVELDVSDHIPFPLEQVVLDFQPLGPSREQAGLQDVLVVAAPRELVRGYLQLARDLGLSVVALTVDALGLHDLVRLRGEGPPGLTIAIEVGHRASTINVSEGGRLRLTRSVALGGQQLTQALRDDLGLEWQDAERLMRTEGLHVLARQPRPARVGAWLDSFCGEVRRSALSAGPAVISRVLLAGAAAATPALDRALAEALGAEPQRLSIRGSFPQAVLWGGDEEAANSCLLAIAQGLRGIGRSAWTISLVPPEVLEARRARLVRRAGLAAALLAALGLLVGYLVSARALAARAAEVSRLREELELARDSMGDIGALREERDRLQAQAERLSEAHIRRYMVLELLRAIGMYAPDELVLTQFTLRANQPVDIRGEAPSLGAAADLQAALARSPLLSRVTLERADTATGRGPTGIVFTLRGDLWTERKPRPEAGELSPMQGLPGGEG